MNNKTKTAIAAGVTAVGVTTAALFGLNTTDETATQSGTTQSGTTQTETIPIVETYEEQTEMTTENGRIISAPTENENTETATESGDYSVSVMSLDDETTENTETEETDPLAPYRTAVEKNGVLIYYYENVPLDLMPLLLKEKTSPYMTLELDEETAAVDDSDLAVVENYIFIQTPVGMKYLSELSNGNVTDDRITDNTLKGYTLYLNQTITCDEWVPFLTFSGSLYGNGNAMYITSVAEGNVSLTIDNVFADYFNGKLTDLTIVCNSEETPFIKTSYGGTFEGVDFDGSVTYLIENAENTTFDDCGIFAKCNAAVNNAVGVTVKNTVIENDMKIALFATAEGSCIIENNIIASTIQGETESSCGAYVGTLKNEIVLKNNLSQCVIDVPVGYGGHAIGYVDYDYKDCENMSGNYFESELTVEGENSTRYIGNIDFKHINSTLEAIDNFDFGSMATAYTVGGVATTVYNLGLMPYGLTLDNETEEIKRLRAAQEKQSEYNGYYEIIDIAAMNDYAKLHGKTLIYEENGRYYFEEPEVPDELTITDVTYTDGNVIIFFNDTVTDKTAIVTTMADNMLLTMSITNITGETVFVEVPPSDEATTVKVMVWENMESMIPVCAAYETEVIQNAE